MIVFATINESWNLILDIALSIHPKGEHYTKQTMIDLSMDIQTGGNTNDDCICCDK